MASRRSWTQVAASLVVVGGAFAFTALDSAEADVIGGTLLCETASNNHMHILFPTEVDDCVDAGMGNLSGNPATDDFLLANPTYTLISKSDELLNNPFSVTGSHTSTTMGTWGFNPTVYNTYSNVFMGFKFGTGNQPDEWFVYDVTNPRFSGTWTFTNVHGTGGELSHMNLYARVPEPSSLVLMGVGFLTLGLGVAWSRRQTAQDLR